MGKGQFMPPREVADYLYDLQKAVDEVWEKHQPDEVIADVKVKWFGEPFAELYEEGWELL